MSYSILIVEDDTKIAASVAAYLTRYGYTPVLVTDFRQVEQEVRQHRPHLVLMDVNLPYQDGFHLTRAIRRHSAVPILFLSVRAGEMEQVMGIESGGDDYMTKPFHLDVLLAKVKAILRRTYGEYAHTEEARTVLQAGDLHLDFMFFLLGFISVLFCLASGNMLYFKLFTDLQTDRKQFQALYKLGLGAEDVRQVVSIQTLLLFFVPFLVALVHTMVIMATMREAMEMELWRPLGLVTAIYLTLYGAYWLVTRRTYTQAVLKR